MMRIFASDGRIGPVRFGMIVVACCGGWFGMARTADHQLLGTVTSFGAISGLALALVSAATRARLHDLDAGIAARAIAMAGLIVLLARLTASQQPSAIKGWPPVVASLALAVVMLRPGVARETRHGPRPDPFSATHPARAARRAGLLAGSICVLGLTFIGFLAENGMRGHQRDTERRIAQEASETVRR